jgi:hypothetical protein
MHFGGRRVAAAPRILGRRSGSAGSELDIEVYHIRNPNDPNGL